MTVELATLTAALEVVRANRELAAAEKKSAMAAERRAALPPGSSRARVTTANARWMTAAEARDRALAMVVDRRETLLEVARALPTAALQAEHRELNAAIDVAYWRFTRQAKGQPPAVTNPAEYIARTAIEEVCAERSAAERAAQGTT